MLKKLKSVFKDATVRSRRMINFDPMPGKDQNKGIASEVFFRTARSGGSGGQHVNKVETKAEAWWHIGTSALYTPEEKARIAVKLKNRINKDGYLIISSTQTRSQAENKQIALQKMYELILQAVTVPKKRKPTKPSKAVIEKRRKVKRQLSEKKQQRRW